MRESQLTGRLRLRHLMESAEAIGEEMAQERERFNRLASPDSAPRVVSAFNLFQTPEVLAKRAAELFASEPQRILEPSAGLGRLYRAIRRRWDECPVTLVEQAADCCGELYRVIEQDRRARLVQDDFLSCDVDRLGTFDAILMNPPFKMGRDIRHIQHARTLLAPRGRLVAFCANGPRQREALKPIASHWFELDPGAFKESGTGVNAAIVIIDKEQS